MVNTRGCPTLNHFSVTFSVFRYCRKFTVATETWVVDARCLDVPPTCLQSRDLAVKLCLFAQCRERVHLVHAVF